MSSPAARLLELLTLLHARPEWPGTILAQRLEISARTLRRDIDQLRGLGYRIAAVKGPAGGYRLAAGSDLPPLLFDDDQAVAIAVALRLIAGTGTDLDEAAARALTTVRQVMPDRLRRRIDALPVTLVPAPDGSERPAVDGTTLSATGAAVHGREVLRFSYGAPQDDGGPVLRRAEPHHLAVWDGRWYVVGWDLDREDWRVFRLDRMTLRSATGVRFEPRPLPGGDLAAFLVGRFRGSPAGSTDWPCRGSITLARAPDEVRAYARDGVVEALGPRHTRLHLGAWSWAALAAEFGRFDAKLRDPEPANLAEAFATLARRFAAAADGT